MFGESQPSVLEDGAQRETGENSRMASFMGAFAICDLVKTTLGPKGMDKILQPMGGGQVKITNDGATISAYSALTARYVRVHFVCDHVCVCVCVRWLCVMGACVGEGAWGIATGVRSRA